jgi:hypothetical protein
MALAFASIMSYITYNNCDLKMPTPSSIGSPSKMSIDLKLANRNGLELKVPQLPVFQSQLEEVRNDSSLPWIVSI